VGTSDVSTPGPGEILIKVEAAGLNPIDWKVQTHGVAKQSYPAILGADGAGTVETIGEGVTRFKKGDRVTFSGGDFSNRSSTFQQYAVEEAEFVAKIPDSMSFDEAASIPLGLDTAAFALYSRHEVAVAKFSVGLYPPWEEGGRGKYAGKPLVVIGGASSVGQNVIQLAKLSGFSPIITTASLRNTEFLVSLGATHVLDRNLAADVLSSEIKKISAAPVELVYDAVFEFADEVSIAQSLVAPGGQLVIVTIDPDAREKFSTAKHAFGIANVPFMREVAASLYAHLTELLEEGSIKPNHVEVLPGGLAGIPDGLERLKAGQISRLKLIARPHETA